MSLFIIFIIVFTIYVYYESKYYNVTYVTSSIDNKPYLVRNKKDKLKAANTLAQINTRLIKLVNYLAKKKKNKNFQRLKQKFNPNNISESLENSKYTSYSVNKGEKIVFCIRSKDSKQSLEKINILMFVAIHELAHLMTTSIGHTPEFWNNFRTLLKYAIKLGVYKKENFKDNPKNYCGTKITDSPLD